MRQARLAPLSVAWFGPVWPVQTANLLTFIDAGHVDTGWAIFGSDQMQVKYKEVK